MRPPPTRASIAQAESPVMVSVTRSPLRTRVPAPEQLLRLAPHTTRPNCGVSPRRTTQSWFGRAPCPACHSPTRLSASTAGPAGTTAAGGGPGTFATTSAGAEGLRSPGGPQPATRARTTNDFFMAPCLSAAARGGKTRGGPWLYPHQFPWGGATGAAGAPICGGGQILPRTDADDMLTTHPFDDDKLREECGVFG